MNRILQALKYQHRIIFKQLKIKLFPNKTVIIINPTDGYRLFKKYWTSYDYVLTF